MKLLLADSAEVQISQYALTSTTVNGSTVDAILFTVKNCTLDEVKRLFVSGETLSVLKIYTDDDLLADTFGGYQLRKSISLTSVDDEFEVMLAKTTDTAERVVVLEKQLPQISATLKTLQDSYKSLSEQGRTTDETLQQTGNKLASVSTSLDAVTLALNELKATVNALDNSKKTDDVTIAKIQKEQDAVNMTLTEIGNTVLEIGNVVNAINTNVTKTIKTMDDSAIATMGMVDQMNLLMENHNTANQTAADAQSVAQLTADGVEKFKTDVVATVDKTNSTVSTLSKDLAVKGNAIESLSATVSGQGSTLTTVEQTLTRATETVSSIQETVSTTAETLHAVEENLATNVETVSAVKETADTAVIELETVKATVADHAEKINLVDLTASELDKKLKELLPVEDITTLDLDTAKLHRVQESREELAKYLETHPITSTCHGGVSAEYSITQEKQTLLQGMLFTAQNAAALGLEYQPSWNARGESCTYDWTVLELAQLGLEMEAVVRPLVSHQQTLEKELLAAATMDALVAIVITYEGIEPNPLPTKQIVEETPTPVE